MTGHLTNLGCARCGQSLEALTCATCKTTFPELAGVPCLFAEPQLQLSDWRNRWRLERQELRRRELAAKNLKTKHARARGDRTAAGLAAQRRAVEHILKPLLADDRGAARETLLGLKTRLPSHHALISYADNVARDWVWGQAENELAADTVATLLPAGAEVVILGSGAGRLAYDLSANHRVTAIESNPLLALLHRQITDGESLSFTEFPRAPRTAEDVCREHNLSAPETRPTTRILLGDALRPPLVRQQVDAVVTHWLVDVVDAPLTRTANIINSLLKPGGVWVNLGSLAFERSDPADNHTLEECEGVLKEVGFDPVSTRSELIPYLASPYSRHQRREEVAIWSATACQSMHPQTPRARPTLADQRCTCATYSRVPNSGNRRARACVCDVSHRWAAQRAGHRQ